MEMNNVVCPVCTLYLRPGITLKSHLTSHPKHKVIEALVRLSSADIQNLEPATEVPESNSNTNNNSVGNTQLHTSAVNQTWNQDNCAATTTTPTPGMQGNHVFIYQQSMSTSGPQPNVLNVSPMSQQYVIPTVLNPQMMPYVYQQQQVIMSSGSCIPQMRVLPFELANDTTDHSSNSGSESHPCIEEVEIEKTQSKLIEIAELEPSNSQKSFEDNLEDDKLDSSKPEKIEDKGYKVENEAVLNMSTRYEVNHETPSCSDWNTSSEQHDLNKACQTQNVVNVSPRSGEHEPEIIENLDKKYYYFNETENSSTYHSKGHMNNIVYDQPEPIYSTANILESNEHLDFVDMDGMHVIIGDFATNPIISQVENYEVNRSDRSGILMNIGGMMDSQKETFNGHAEIEESMSRGSTMVNMRTDERMPPRGELSGQESIGDTSDMNWSRLHYNEGSSARESWEASDVSDVDEPPMDHQVQLAAEPDDNDVPSVVGYIAPPLNFKCSLCGEAFPCLQDRKEHDLEQHPDKLKSTLVGGKIAGQRKVKKLVVKLKSETENFDVVFTNKIKVETNNETKTTDDDQILATELKTDENISVDSRTVCSLCNCVMSDVKALREHKLEVHKISPDLRFKCSTCDESFPNEYKYTEHLKVHPLECRLCGKLFYRRQNMQLHMKRHLGIKPYKCEICEKAFLTKQKLEEHRNTHTGNSPIKCTLCDETFRRHSNLVQHRNRHHLKLKKKVKDYVCYCGEYFHSKKKLAWHKETHDPKPKACTKCSEKFIHLSSLTRHMRRAHNERFLPKEERSNENVECPICKGVYLRSSLDVHIRNHSGLRPFSCLICNKDFTTRWNLKLHKWTHASRVSKPFKCDQCKGAFIRESDYTAHMNSHKSIRPYTCNYCGAQFIRKYNCQRHVKEHENVKTFNCQVCGKSFHRSYYLKDHMRVHSGIRPFTCHVCGKTSTTKSNHNKHVQIHHAREPVSTEN